MSSPAGTGRSGHDAADTGGGDRPRGGSRQGGRPKGGGNQGGRPKGGGRRDPRRDEEQEAVVLRSKLLSLLKRLPDIERKVLEARMGLIDGTPMKPGEVATLMGMTIPEIKKIEMRAFERIREIGPLKGLERFLSH